MTAATILDPQAGYVVTASSSFANFNDQTLVTFYQPIIGPVAFSLFYALKAHLQSHPTITERTMQSSLLAQLNAGGRQVAEALHRLEAVGLVQTYFQHDDLGDVYVYELQATLLPADFVNDNLLSILLLEEIGDQAFEHLVAHSRRFKLASTKTNLTNISHHFFDEFHINSQSITTTPTPIKQARHSITVDPQPTLMTAEPTDFDWATLKQLLANQPIVQGDLTNNQELIILEHRLYGIDEPTMKKLILRSINLRDNHFDPQKFKRIIASTYNIVYQQPAKVAEKQSTVTDKQQLTANDQQLLTMAKEYAPVEFLQDLKAQTGGYVTSGERHILTHLLDDTELAGDAINILSWYVLGDRGNSTLSTNFVDAIANNWLQHGIKTGAQALLQLKTFNQQTKNKPKQANNPQQKKWKKPIKEPMPEWSKKDNQELMKKASAQEVAKLRQRIANRKKKN